MLLIMSNNLYSFFSTPNCKLSTCGSVVLSLNVLHSYISQQHCFGNNDFSLNAPLTYLYCIITVISLNFLECKVCGNTEFRTVRNEH